MNYRFHLTEWFSRNLKQLRKRNPQLRSDLASFFQSFEAEKHPILPGTGGVRKARMRITGRGKRGGYRVVYYWPAGKDVWLLTIYDKVRQEDLTSSEKQRIRQIVSDLKDSASFL